MGSDSGNYLSQIYGYLTREKKQIRKAIEKICQNRAQHIFVLPKKKKKKKNNQKKYKKKARTEYFLTKKKKKKTSFKWAHFFLWSMAASQLCFQSIFKDV